MVVETLIFAPNLSRPNFARHSYVDNGFLSGFGIGAHKPVLRPSLPLFVLQPLAGPVRSGIISCMFLL